MWEKLEIMEMEHFIFFALEISRYQNLLQHLSRGFNG